MAYSRREVKDHVTVMNKDLYDNLQDGIDESKKAVSDLEVSTDGKISEVDEKADTALSISKGKNRAHVFLTTQSMQTWLSNELNKDICKVGDNLYIVDVGVPDWWIAEILDEVDPETGYYYKIAQLETQKVDLTEILKSIEALKEYTQEISYNLTTEDGYNFRVGRDEKGNLGYVIADETGADTVIPFNNLEEVAHNLIIENVTETNSCWGSKGTLDTTATYTATRDGIVSLNGSCTASRTANQNVASSASSHFYVFNNNELLYNSDDGDAVHQTTLSISVKEGDTITFIYRLKWVSGDSMYMNTMVSLALVIL